MIIKKFTYRPEVDGLRALAVLSVLFYHVGLGFPGGYIGVDIFFVISGYLITTLLIKEMQEDRFTFAHFYERRIRRIFPASVVLMFLTGVAGLFLLLPSDFIGLGRSITSQTFFSSNFYFWRNTNYFAESAELQPLLHTWSLAVEEQFYMVMPILLWIIIRKTKTALKTKLLVTLAFLFLLSLIFSILTLKGMPAFTFYLLPTRAWELLLGSLVALVPSIALLKKNIFRETLVVLGLIGMVLPCFLYTKDTLFPGLAAIPPCLGAGLFIIGSSHYENTTLPVTAKLFTWRPIIFIGLISYSLYLWHWPLVAFYNYWALEDVTLIHKWLIILFSFILAIASWRFVETPFRKKTIIEGQKRLFKYAFAVSAVLILLGISIVFKNGFQGRFNERVLAYDRAKAEALHENRISLPVNLEDAVAGNLPVFGNSVSSNVDVLVWGDSHARSIIPAVVAAAKGQNSVATAWHSSTPPIVDFIPAEVFAEFSLKTESPAWSAAIIRHVKKNEIKNVLLVARWSGYYNSVKYDVEDKDAAIKNFNNSFIQTIEELKKAGAKVWVLREIPAHAVSVPKVLIKAEVLGADISKYQGTKEQLNNLNKEFDLVQSKLKKAGAQIIDLSDLLFDKASAKFMMIYNGEALYYDNHHLTIFGAKMVSKGFKHLFLNSEPK